MPIATPIEVRALGMPAAVDQLFLLTLYTSTVPTGTVTTCSPPKV